MIVTKLAKNQKEQIEQDILDDKNIKSAKKFDLRKTDNYEK